MTYRSSTRSPLLLQIIPGCFLSVSHPGDRSFAVLGGLFINLLEQDRFIDGNRGRGRKERFLW